jgi:CheY-like chemotaxis protein
MFNLARERQSPNLLLIDDDLVSREVTATVLTMSGYLVHTAEDGAASIELLESGSCAPDAILMDAQMPGLSGVPLIEALRAHSRARVFAISASSATDEVAAAVDGFLLKPFNAEEFTRLLATSEAQTSQHALQTAAPVNQTLPHATQPVQASAGPVVSPATLAQLRELMSDAAVREIYAVMVTDLSRRLAALEVAIAGGDEDEARRIGHSIKGGCAMAGAMQLARLGALLESGNAGSDSNHLNNNRALLSDLRAAARNLESMLEAEFPA